MPTLKQIRFNIQIKALNEIIVKARKDKNQGLTFYRLGARNVIFRLEALCRIYRKIDDAKFFDIWYKIFKELEDLLGALDHNEAMLREFSGTKELKGSAERIFGERFKEGLVYLGSVLKENGWLDGQLMQGFQDEILKRDGLNEDKDRKEIARFLIGEMDDLEKEYRKGKIDLMHLETGVHEFRRKLRWLSIYALVVDGLIQLRPVKAMDDIQQEYCSPEIVSSPFNIMPPPPEGKKLLFIQSTPFYALSWLIQFLGDLKDTGLRRSAFDELMHSTKIQSSKTREAMVKRYNASLKIKVEDISVTSEYEVDLFLYSQRVLKTIIRDLNRNIQAD